MKLWGIYDSSMWGIVQYLALLVLIFILLACIWVTKNTEYEYQFEQLCCTILRRLPLLQAWKLTRIPDMLGAIVQHFPPSFSFVGISFCSWGRNERIKIWSVSRQSNWNGISYAHDYVYVCLVNYLLLRIAMYQYHVTNKVWQNKLKRKSSRTLFYKSYRICCKVEGTNFGFLSSWSVSSQIGLIIKMFEFLADQENDFFLVKR